MTVREQSDSDPGNRAANWNQPMFHRVLDAHPITVRATLQDVRRRFSFDLSEDTLGRLELVLAEVMNNITEHAAAPKQGAKLSLPSIHLSIVRHNTGLACALTDDGTSLPAACLQPRNLPSMITEDLPEGGFGWFLIQDLTQSLCYYREENRNYLAFKIPFASTAKLAP